ncbi:mitochondrial peripheral inner membrane protein [Sporothrix stenoceras]|uniref:Mitochondrial peripheral inner membrane protein n=1 Tax=Sporothrix stenoceras TaxID=5173 RepID=A0ABR3Z8N9_9PEZI
MRHTVKPSLLGNVSTGTIQRWICSLQPRLQHHIKQPLTASEPTDIQSIRWQRTFSSSRPHRKLTPPQKGAPSPSPPPPPPPKTRRSPLLLLTLAVLAGSAVYWATAGSTSGSFDDNGQRRLAAGGGIGLNKETFVPFAVVAREEVSPTAFVLTLRLPEGVSDEGRTRTVDAIKAAWQHGLWSVEVKQPQLQIARDYTPLPNVDGVPNEDGTEMRLFVRVVHGGEVSRYLSRRTVGSTVDVRGPRLSFDVAARVGEAGGKETTTKGGEKQVVVLAGGTGISTALQAAHAVLGQGTSVSILWANRQADDSIGLNETGNGAAVNPVVRDIKALQSRYGSDRVHIHNFVDAQQTWITEASVRKSIEGTDGAASGGSWYWPWGKTQKKTAVVPQPDTTNPTCVYHSPRMLERMEADVLRGSPKAKKCSCGTTAESTTGQAGGKNLVLVSGPDGFIAAWAGPKTWAGGQERQGPMSGILGHMAAKDPQTFAKWQVLKL